jgi:hypothetical protein
MRAWFAAVAAIIGLTFAGLADAKTALPDPPPCNALRAQWNDISAGDDDARSFLARVPETCPNLRAQIGGVILQRSPQAHAGSPSATSTAPASGASQSWDQNSSLYDARSCSAPGSNCPSAFQGLPSRNDRIAAARSVGVESVPDQYLNGAVAVTPQQPRQAGGWFEWRFGSSNAGTSTAAAPNYASQHSHGQATIHLTNAPGARFLLNCTVRAAHLAMRTDSATRMTDGSLQPRTVSIVTALSEDHVDFYSPADEAWWFYGCWITRVH